MATMAEKAARFKALHEEQGAFIMPNPWDRGSAKVMEHLGFKALATTSAGFAHTLGRADGALSAQENIEHCRDLGSAVAVPMSADLENCYADDPQDAAKTLLAAAKAGMAGGSIEDYDGARIYDFNHAVERVRAAAEVLGSRPHPFMLTARAENLIRGVPDFDDTIRRLQAFAAAGADVLYAPGLKTIAEIRTVVQSVGKPLNVLAPMARGVSVEEMAAAGVKRISLGGALLRAVMASLFTAGTQMLEEGTFTWTGALTREKDIASLY
ncbi:MAG: isocitrate lyase/phosphoenolpyruvate mutase family protein [Gammaproteobacteria bacterium]|nr:isocitrate lyase/phosphoenolpyruvate mutase family protein [Gammaproteobacteria bacterium]